MRCLGKVPVEEEVGVAGSRGKPCGEEGGM